MATLMQNVLPLVSLLAWAGLWGIGGIWIARSAFTLRRNELALTGFGLGLILENWCANLLGQWMPVRIAFWLAAGLVALTGLLFSWKQVRQKPLSLLRIPILPLQWLVFGILIYVFFVIGRGLAMLDDLQNIPIASFIAAGDIPPHFSMDPDVSYGYHYFTLLFSAQLMHIADLFVWTAMDLARGLGFALSLMLTALFVQRVTGSRLAGFVGGLMRAFAGGTRWLLLLLPQGVLKYLGADLTLLGSGANSGSDLTSALGSAWAASGMGPFPFPFAYVNGFNSTHVILYHAGSGGLNALLAALLLLLHNKWRNWRAWVIVSILLASFGLANEVSLLVICAGVVMVMGVYLAVKRSWRLPESLWRWFIAAFAGGLIALFQGGVITTLAVSKLAAFFPNWFQAEEAYHTFSFSLFWPPKVLSSHLGYLALNDPVQILLALAEIGPILLVLPLVIAWMVKAFRYQRWYECMLAFVAAASLGLSVVKLSGAAGLTAMTRVQSLPIDVLITFAVPALWLWARQRSDAIKTWAGVFLVVNMFGGFMLFGISLLAAPQPVTTEFTSTMDIKMLELYWDKLEEDVLVFDHNPYRSPIVFGRANNSSYNVFEHKPEWEALTENPDPYVLNAAGYTYMYIDKTYWDSLTNVQQIALQDPCVVLVHEETHKHLDDYRRLLDVRQCR